MSFDDVKPLYAATSAIPINVSGGDQVLPRPCRYIYVGAESTVVCRLAMDDTDTSFVALAPGRLHRISATVIRQAGSTITSGRVLF